METPEELLTNSSSLAPLTGLTEESPPDIVNVCLADPPDLAAADSPGSRSRLADLVTDMLLFAAFRPLDGQSEAMEANIEAHCLRGTPDTTLCGGSFTVMDMSMS
jgi:hypothetical protein